MHRDRGEQGAGKPRTCALLKKANSVTTAYVLIFVSSWATFSASFETRQDCENALHRIRTEAGFDTAPPQWRQPVMFCTPTK